MMSRRTISAPLLLAAMVLSLAACGDETDHICHEANPPIECVLKAPTSEANLLDNLQAAYEYRDVAAYSDLLADDFRFYFDPDTRSSNNLPEFWNSDTDSTQTGRLFTSTKVSEIRVNLTFNRTAVPDSRPGWSYIIVQDTFLEVDQIPDQSEPEGITFRVDGQIQKFYFRKGKSPADTLATSATAQRYYIVEWRDFGFGTGALASSAAVRPNTWGQIKASKNVS